MTGIGIRMAQDIGAHRRKVYSAGPSVESELWKRAFWSVINCNLDLTSSVPNLCYYYFYRVLVAMDRAGSAALGRPCAIQDEELVASFSLSMPQG